MANADEGKRKDWEEILLATGARVLNLQDISVEYLIKNILSISMCIVDPSWNIRENIKNKSSFSQFSNQKRVIETLQKARVPFQTYEWAAAHVEAMALFEAS